MNPQAQNHLDELKKKLAQVESLLISARKSLEKLEHEYLRPDYTQVEGMVGVYDGKYMVAQDGTKIEVPSNYAAKTKLVFGDTLKQIEEDGKKLFKQIERVEREKVEGIMTKKEGEWYLLTDRGSYKVLDTAADFQGAELNSQATAFVPKNKLDSPFATIDIIEGFGRKAEPEKPQAPVKQEPTKQASTRQAPSKQVPAKAELPAKVKESPQEKPTKTEEREKAPEKSRKPTQSYKRENKPSIYKKSEAEKPQPTNEEVEEKHTPAKEIVLEADDLV